MSLGTSGDRENFVRLPTSRVAKIVLLYVLSKYKYYYSTLPSYLLLLKLVSLEEHSSTFRVFPTLSISNKSIKVFVILKLRIIV